MMRYTLIRTLNSMNKKQILFIGLNPSTATFDTDDQTTKKLIEFTKIWGYGKYTLVNLFPYRATDHKELVNYNNQRAQVNRDIIRKNLSKTNKSNLVIPMWGNINKIPKHLHGEVLAIEQMIKPFNPQCFGKNKDGSPKHPLMLSYDTQLERF